MVLIIIGWVLFRATGLAQVREMVSAMFGFAPGGLWNVETAYYLRQFSWEWIFAIPAALPVKVWLQSLLETRREQGSRLSAAALVLGSKLLGAALLGLSVVRLLSSTFRSFLYFQF